MKYSIDDFRKSVLVGKATEYQIEVSHGGWAGNCETQSWLARLSER
jgi:hypothetical protein